MKITITPAMAVILHIVWSGALGVILGGGTAVYQYNTTHGVNLGQDAVLFVLTIVTGLGSATIQIWHNIQASPALPVVEQEAESALAQEAKQIAENAHVEISRLVEWLQQHMQGHAPSMPPQSAQKAGITKPEWMQQLSQSSTSVAPPTSTQQAGSVPMTTLPGMPAIPSQQQ